MIRKGQARAFYLTKRGTGFDVDGNGEIKAALPAWRIMLIEGGQQRRRDRADHPRFLRAVQDPVRYAIATSLQRFWTRSTTAS